MLAAVWGMAFVLKGGQPFSVCFAEAGPSGALGVASANLFSWVVFASFVTFLVGLVWIVGIPLPPDDGPGADPSSSAGS